jgi:hypothetical protein
MHNFSAFCAVLHMAHLPGIEIPKSGQTHSERSFAYSKRYNRELILMERTKQLTNNLKGDRDGNTNTYR